MVPTQGGRSIAVNDIEPVLKTELILPEVARKKKPVVFADVVISLGVYIIKYSMLLRTCSFFDSFKNRSA